MRQAETATVDTTYTDIGDGFVVVAGDSDVYVGARLRTTVEVISGSSCEVRLRGRQRFDQGEPGAAESGWVTVSSTSSLGSGDEPYTAMGDLEFDEYQWQARAASGTADVKALYHATE